MKKLVLIFICLFSFSVLAEDSLSIDTTNINFIIPQENKYLNDLCSNRYINIDKKNLKCPADINLLKNKFKRCSYQTDCPDDNYCENSVCIKPNFIDDWYCGESMDFNGYDIEILGGDRDLYKKNNASIACKKIGGILPTSKDLEKNIKKLSKVGCVGGFVAVLNDREQTAYFTRTEIKYFKYSMGQLACKRSQGE